MDVMKKYRFDRVADLDIMDNVTVEFWKMINPLMLILGDILSICEYNPSAKGRSLDYEDGWYDLADAISDLLECEGILDEIEAVMD